LDRNELARHQRVLRTQLFERPALPKHQAKEGRGVDVRRHRRRRSSSRTAKLSVRFASGAGTLTSRRRRMARRISTGSAAYGTILATGVARSNWVTLRPLQGFERLAQSGLEASDSHILP